ncbi:MAG: Rrf2 family transcriptional regulator [Oscillospiraceae bacterium]|jgi:Rrf2 family protein|nr:Rrf2 family transcriptional regulator [Oscillospiraceae bacterium]
MKISTKGRYALMMLLDLAMHTGDGFVALKDIAQRQGISKKYLEQIVPLLNREDILLTTRGFQGGYMLAKPAEKYTVGYILRVAEGSISPVDFAEFDSDSLEASMTSDLWKGLDKVIAEYLDRITLSDLIDKYYERTLSEYYI